MTELLPNFVSGQSLVGAGAGTPSLDPVLGNGLVRVDATGLDQHATFDVAAMHTGHGNVMPQPLHGGPGRAGGGEERGGLRALNFYRRRAAVQASTAVLSQLIQANTTDP